MQYKFYDIGAKEYGIVDEELLVNGSYASASKQISNLEA